MKTRVLKMRVRRFLNFTKRYCYEDYIKRKERFDALIKVLEQTWKAIIKAECGTDDEMLDLVMNGNDVKPFIRVHYRSGRVLFELNEHILRPIRAWDMQTVLVIAELADKFITKHGLPDAYSKAMNDALNVVGMYDSFEECLTVDESVNALKRVLDVSV